MDEKNVTQPDLSRKALALIKRSEMRRRRGCNRTQEWKEIKNNPDWPRLVWINGIGYYVEHEAEAYIAQLIERGRDAKAAAPEQPSPPSA